MKGEQPVGFVKELSKLVSEFGDAKRILFQKYSRKEPLTSEEEETVRRHVATSENERIVRDLQTTISFQKSEIADLKARLEEQSLAITVPSISTMPRVSIPSTIPESPLPTDWLNDLKRSPLRHVMKLRGEKEMPAFLNLNPESANGDSNSLGGPSQSLWIPTHRSSPRRNGSDQSSFSFPGGVAGSAPRSMLKIRDSSTAKDVDTELVLAPPATLLNTLQQAINQGAWDDDEYVIEEPFYEQPQEPVAPVLCRSPSWAERQDRQGGEARWRGRWKGTDGHIKTILGDTIIWQEDGRTEKFEVISGNRCKVWHHGEVYDGSLENGQIVWADGDIWKKEPSAKKAATSAQPTPSQASSEKPAGKVSTDAAQHDTIEPPGASASQTVPPLVERSSSSSSKTTDTSTKSELIRQHVQHFKDTWWNCRQLFKNQHRELDDNYKGLTAIKPQFRRARVNKARLRMAEAEVTLGGMSARLGNMKRYLTEVEWKKYTGELMEMRKTLDASENDMDAELKLHYLQLTGRSAKPRVARKRTPIKRKDVSKAFIVSHQPVIAQFTVHTDAEIATMLRQHLDRVRVCDGASEDGTNSGQRGPIYHVFINERPFGFTTSTYPADRLRVVSIRPDSLAEKAGMSEGDYLLYCNDLKIDGSNWSDVYWQTKLPMSLMLARALMPTADEEEKRDLRLENARRRGNSPLVRELSQSAHVPDQADSSYPTVRQFGKDKSAKDM